jgi:hypothetical protein
MATTPGTSDPQATAAADLAKLDTFMGLATKLSQEMNKWANPLSRTLDGMLKLQNSADALNKSFLGNRKRIEELAKAVAETAPDIIALGGEFKDAAATIDGIAAGARRAVVASTDQIKQLYATSQLAGKNVNELVEAFGKVGIQYEQISGNVEDSIAAVRNLGVNTRAVLGDVVANTEKLARFNFENGIVGLSKMAAQASMLRFDMAETFKLADDVLDPDRAIEVASAFQRLGVSAGNLVDPFQLMNQSINDPQGLQNSLINIGKQFTYFDEKTKSFKINPQGILTLREVAKQTGVSAENLTKSALAAADFDQRLAAISKADLFPEVTEEDKTLIANMARMGKEGEYEIKVKTDTGTEYVKVSQATNAQLKQLVNESKEEKKSVEEIQTEQLDLSTSMLKNVESINEKLSMYLIANDKTLRGTLETAKGVRDATNSMAQSGVNQGFRNNLMQAQTRLSEAKTPEEKKKAEDELQRTITTAVGTSARAFTDALGAAGTKKGAVPLGSISDYMATALTPLTQGLDISKLSGVSPDVTKKTTTVEGINTDLLFGKTRGVEQTMKTKASEPKDVNLKWPQENPPAIKMIIEKGASLQDIDTKVIERAFENSSIRLDQLLFMKVENQAKAVGQESRLPK